MKYKLGLITLLSLLMLTACAQNSTSPLDANLPHPQKGDKIVTLDTDFGTIKFKLYSKEVPEMSKNFEELANAGKYSDVPFHRVIKDFMIQSGDFTNKNGTGGHSYKGPDTSLPDEINSSLHHIYGAVSMANSGPNTNGSQFFIVTAHDGVAFLDGKYTIFGQVFQGMDVSEKIADLFIPQSGQAGTPSQIVNIKKATVEIQK